VSVSGRGDKDITSLRGIPLSEKAERLLRYDEALNASWQESPNTRYQAVFLPAGVVCVQL
jgi:hypothetical protein